MDFIIIRLLFIIYILKYIHRCITHFVGYQAPTANWITLVSKLAFYFSAKKNALWYEELTFTSKINFEPGQLLLGLNLEQLTKGWRVWLAIVFHTSSKLHFTWLRQYISQLKCQVLTSACTALFTSLTSTGKALLMVSWTFFCIFASVLFQYYLYCALL